MRSIAGMANRQGDVRLALRASLRPQLTLWLGLAWPFSLFAVDRGRRAVRSGVTSGCTDRGRREVRSGVICGCTDRGWRAVRSWSDMWVYGQRKESSEELE